MILGVNGLGNVVFIIYSSSSLLRYHLLAL